MGLALGASGLRLEWSEENIQRHRRTSAEDGWVSGSETIHSATAHPKPMLSIGFFWLFTIYSSLAPPIPSVLEIQFSGVRPMSSTAAKLVYDYSLADFKHSIEAFEKTVANHANIPPRSVPESVWNDFMNLSPQQRHAAIEQINTYTELLTEAVNNGIGLLGDKKLAWFAMSKLKLVPPNGFLDIVEQGDYIEIYDAGGIQIFRSLEFYSLISYSIAEVTLYPWDKLYRRDPKILAQIVEQGFVKGFSGIKEPYKLQIDDHEVDEAISQEKRHFKLSFGWLVPLGDTRFNVRAVFATSKIER